MDTQIDDPHVGPIRRVGPAATPTGRMWLAALLRMLADMAFRMR